MTTLAVIGLISWLGILTIAVCAIARQVGIQGLKLNGALSSIPLEAPVPLGSKLGERTLDFIGHKGEPQALFLLSSSCSSCRDIALYLSKSEPQVPTTVVLVGLGPSADALASLIPASMRLVQGAEAQVVWEELDSPGTPMGLRVSVGRIEAATILYDEADVSKLMNATLRGSGFSHLEIVGG